MSRKTTSPLVSGIFRIITLILWATFLIAATMGMTRNDDVQNRAEKKIENRSGGAGSGASSGKSVSSEKQKTIDLKGQIQPDVSKKPDAPVRTIKKAVAQSGGGHGTKIKIADRKTVPDKSLKKKDGK